VYKYRYGSHMDSGVLLKLAVGNSLTQPPYDIQAI